MKKYKMISILLGTTLLLCSCQKEATIINSEEMPKHVAQELEKNLSIDADIIIPEGIQSNVPILEIEPKVFDVKTIISKLYPNAVALYDDEDIYKDEKSTINITNGDYYYNNKNERIYTRFFTEQEELLFPTVSNLEGLDVEISLEKAKDYLSDIGLDNIELNSYYVLSKDFLQEQYNAIKKENNWQDDVNAGREVLKDDWEIERGAYIFNFEVIQNGIPISQGMYHTKDNEYISGSSVKICCNEDGITFVDSVANYSVKNTSGSKKLAGIDTLMKGISHKFSNLIIQEPITLNKIRLVYQAQKVRGTLYLIPVWEVQYLEQCEGTLSKGIIYFEVETGKEIIIY